MFLIYYIIFALATTILFTIYIVIPVVNDVYKTVPVPAIVRNGHKYAVMLALIIPCLVAAPLFLLVCLVPSFTDKFVSVLSKDLKEA